MFNQSGLRRFLRWGHIAEGIYLGVYVYSGLHLNPTWTNVTRFLVFPLIGLSGAWMWQQGRVARWMRSLPPITKYRTTTHAEL